MATARRATARQVTTTMMIAMSKDDDDEDGDGATGDEVDDDGDVLPSPTLSTSRDDGGWRGAQKPVVHRTNAGRR